MDLLILVCLLIAFSDPVISCKTSAKLNKIVLINPNSNQNATKAMADLARLEVKNKFEIVERSNTGVPPLLTTPQDMLNAVSGVVSIGKDVSKDNDVVAIIVSAFGDPGLKELREVVEIPVFGIGEEVFHAAAEGNRTFGIVTITPNPGVLKSFADKAKSLGYANLYKGVRLTEGDMNELVASPRMLDAALKVAVNISITLDSADAVIVGCGPCSTAGLRIQKYFEIPIQVAVSAAARAAMKTVS